MPEIRLETALSSDALASAGTAFSIDIGGTAHGSIAGTDDQDWLAVDLLAGQTYTFALVGIGASRLTDGYLTLIDRDGSTVLLENDDGMPNANAIMQFTATADGRYFLEAAGLNAAAGDYGIAATLGSTADFDSDMITGAIQSDRSWSGAAATGVAITFGFRDTYSGSNPNFSHLSTTQIAAARAALAYYSEISGLIFTEINPGGFTNNATILFGNYSANDGAAAYAYYPGSTSFSSAAGDVWINTDTPELKNTDPTVFLDGLLLHELGHAMGLSHPGIYDATAGGRITYESNAQFVQDSNQFTVMSYFDASMTGGSSAEPDTLMLHDIQAIQLKYGANLGTRATNTTYGHDSTAGDLYDFSVNPDAVFTIWDGGGTDMLSASRFAMDQVITLQEGGFSNIGGMEKNISIAFGAQIENARGGRGSDIISGNAGKNRLEGGDGDDSILGQDGNDVLFGGNGNDTLLGGRGNDTLSGGYVSQNVASADYGTEFTLVSTDSSERATLNLAGVNVFPTGSFTIEMIWQQNSLDDPHYSVDFGNLSFYRFASGKMSIKFWGATEEDWLYNSLPEAMTDGAAHRISISYDDGDGQFRIYLDGSESWAHKFAPGSRAITPTGNIALDDDASVGDLRIFDYARSADQIWTNAWDQIDARNEGPGLVQYWVGDGAGRLVSAIAGKADLVSTGATGTDTARFGSVNLGDDLLGGSGNDLYYISNSADRVIELADQGFDRIGAHTDYALAAGSSVEVLFSAATKGGLRLDGNAFANVLRSNQAADTLAGGAGNDRYFVNSAADVVIEAEAQGKDFVTTTANYQLAAGSEIEILIGTGTNGLSLGGNEYDNEIYGTFGADRLSGGAGKDLLVGKNDAAADVFVFTNLGDSTAGADRDVIRDFTTGLDHIDLSGIDANLAIAGNQSLAFSDTFAAANSVWYSVFSANLRLRADVDGDAIADFEVALINAQSLTADDFIL